MDIKRADSWLVKGFDGITNLIIQRSQKPASSELVQMLEAAMNNLEIVSGSVILRDSDLDADFQMFSTLLQLSHMLLARVQADKSFDESNIESLRGYMATLRKALERFHENTTGNKRICDSSL
jgi:D-mannonate dehydratase